MLNSLFLTIFQDFRFFSAEVDSKIQSIPSNIAENLTSLSLTGVGTARDFGGCRSMDAYPTKLDNYVMAATHKKKPHCSVCCTPFLFLPPMAPPDHELAGWTSVQAPHELSKPAVLMPSPGRIVGVRAGWLGFLLVRWWVSYPWAWQMCNFGWAWQVFAIIGEWLVWKDWKHYFQSWKRQNSQLPSLNLCQGRSILRSVTFLISPSLYRSWNYSLRGNQEVFAFSFSGKDRKSR